MSVTSRDSRAAEGARGQADDPEPGAAERRSRLHQPWRVAVAALELLLAAGAVWLAFVLWADGVTVIPATDLNGAPVELSHYHGDVIALAVGVGLIAVLLVVDAVRQLLLGLRARPRKQAAAAEPDASEPWPSYDEDA